MEMDGTLILDFQAPRIVRKKIFFINYPVSGILSEQPKGLWWLPMTRQHTWSICSNTTPAEAGQHATYSRMCFTLVLAIALLKTVGPGDMSAAILVLVSENQCMAFSDFISTPVTSRQRSRAIRKQKLIHLYHG
jgi:hypothetical protein